MAWGRSMPDWWSDSDSLRNALTEPPGLLPPKRKFDLSQVRPGWLVLDNESEPVGRIGGQIDRYLIVQRSFHGFYLWMRLYIPEGAVGEVHEGSVSLNIPRDWIPGMGWNRPPRKPPTGWRDH
jgi:hypothetical protein